MKVGLSKLQRGKGKWCSRTCQLKDVSTEVTCKVCGHGFTTYAKLIKTGGGKFCSRPCYKIDWCKRIPGWNKGKPAVWALGNKHRLGTKNPNPYVLYGSENGNWKHGETIGEKRKHYFNRKRHDYRARKRSNGGFYSNQEWEDLKSKYGYKCLCCGKEEKHGILNVDHIVPISKGGRNDISNIQPLCKSCNSKKRDKIIDYRK